MDGKMKAKPLLTNKNKADRLLFAKKYLHFTIDDWKKVIFSKESSISKLGSTAPKYCFQKMGDGYNTKYVYGTKI